MTAREKVKHGEWSTWVETNLNFGLRRAQQYIQMYEREYSLTTLRDKLVKIGAKVVRHGRYVTFQLAEVAVPRKLFTEILRLIGGLRARPAPP